MTEQGFYDSEAEAELRQKIADGSQDPNDYRDFADLLVASGLDEEAVSIYERALNLPLTNFQRATVSMELGWLFYNMRQLEQAQMLSHSALECISQEKESAEILACRGASQSLLAYCLWFTDPNAGDKAGREALEWVEQAVRGTGEFEGKVGAYIDAARLHNSLGNTKKSIEFCEKCLQRDLMEKDRLPCLMVYAEALRREGRFEEGQQCVKEAFPYVKKYNGLLPALYLELGLNQRFANLLTEARKTLQQALEAGKADSYLKDEPRFLAEVYFNLASVSYELADYDEAAAAYEKVLLYCPEEDHYHSSALLWLGHCYFEKGDHGRARDYYEKVMAAPHASEADKVAARGSLVKLPLSTKNMSVFIEKIVLYFQLIWHHVEFYGFPISTESYYANLGATYFKLGKFRKAVKTFEKSEKTRPSGDIPSARYNSYYLGYGYLNLKEYPKALEYFQKYVSLKPNDAEVEAVVMWCEAQMNPKQRSSSEIQEKEVVR
ncbi:MAG: tetratricopeptide repeat protein [Candidatus Binatia bacterium]